MTSRGNPSALEMMGGWLRPPVFADEEQTRVARLLYTILLTLIVVDAFYLIVLPLIGGPQLGLSLILVSAILIIYLGMLALIRQGRVRFTSLLLTGLIWTILALVALADGGMLALSVRLYGIAVLIAGFLLGSRAALILAGLSVMCGLIMIYAQPHFSWMPEPVAHRPIEIWIVEAAGLLITVVLLTLATRGLQQALQQSRQNEQALRTREAEKQALLVEQQRSQQALQKQTERLAALYTANLALTQSLDSQAVLETLLDKMHTLIPYDTANVMLCESETTLRVYAGRGYEKWNAHETALLTTFDTRSNPVMETLVRTQKSILISDTRAVPGWQRTEGGAHVLNWLGVPLIAAGEMIGLYSLDHSQPATFTEEHVQLAEALAGAAAMAIQNARLYEQIHQEADKLEQRVKERTLQLEVANETLTQEMAERALAEISLRQNEARLRAVTSHYPNGAIVLFDHDFRYLLVDGMGLSVVGLDKEKMLGKTIYEVFPPETYTRLEDYYRSALSGLPVTYEIPYGNRFYFVRTHPVMNEDGDIIAGITISQDITELKAAEDALRESEARYEMLSRISPVGIFHVDTDSNCTYVNKRWCEIAGLSPEEALGKGWMNAIYSEDREQVLKEWHNAIQHNEAFNFEYRFQRPDKGITWVFGQAAVEKDAQEKSVGFVGTITDITQQKQTEDVIRNLYSDLSQRATQLEAANRELEGFTYSVSHDLRAPLRAMHGFSRVLQQEYKPDLPEPAQHYLNRIQHNAQRMGDLVDGLLQFSRVGRQVLQKHKVMPDEIARRVLSDLLAKYEGTPPTVKIDALPACEADPILMREVFLHLLGNALKFSQKQETPTIEVSWKAGEHQEPVYQVSDNGVGFNMQYSDKLFGVFQQLHSPGEYEGIGIGLAIAQRIIHRHGGKIWAESAPHQGATFFFTLQ